MGKTEALEPYVHNLRPHVGQKKVAANLSCNGSALVNKPKEMIQDAYTLRCIPQVHGASRDAFEYFRIIVEIETNSVTDDPIVFTEMKKIASAGQFHGQPLSIAFDVLGIALSEISNFSERRLIV